MDPLDLDNMRFEFDLSFETGNSTDRIPEELKDFELQYDKACTRAWSEKFNKVFLPTVYGILFVVGITGNGLVLFVTGYQKKVKTTMDKYRLHLCVADLLFIFTLPFWAADAAHTWYFGQFLCVSVHMVYSINFYSSVWLLACVSFDRYLAIIRPTTSQAKRQLLVNKVIYAGVWLPAVALAVPDMVFARVGLINQEPSDDTRITDERGFVSESRITCHRVFPTQTGLTLTLAFRFQHILVGFVLPGLVISICYGAIAAELSREGSMGRTVKKKALKTTVVVVACFFLCWLPYGIGIFVDTLFMLNTTPRSCTLQQVMEKWISVTETLAYFHCCLDPILYAFIGVKFKKTTVESILSVRRKPNRKRPAVTKPGPDVQVLNENLRLDNVVV